MNCPKCGHELSDRASMCPYCGEDWADGKDKDGNNDPRVYCPNCGKEIPQVAKFCPLCGQPVTPNFSGPSEAGSRARQQDITDKDTHNNLPSMPPRKTQEPNKRKRLYFIGALAIAGVIAIVYVLFIFNPFNPNHLKETGSYELQIGDTLELPSIDVSIQFVDFVIGIPDYSDITVDVQYIFTVNLPNDRSCEECFLWLDEFQINGTPAEYQVGTYSWNEFQPVSPDYLETETMAFAVTYESTYTDLSYTMHCAASEDLDITFISDQSFWDVVNVDPNNTVTDYQAKLDLQNGIFTYDLTESDETDFEIDGWYKLTGRVLYSGKYMGELTDDYQICFSMAEASWWPQYYCYFTEEEWNRLPDLSSGDIVTLYGRYDYVAIVGYNFHDCTIESPAGTFMLNDAGEAEVIPFGLLDEDDNTSVSSPPDYSYEGDQTNDYVNILGKYEHESNGCVVTINEFTGEGGGYTIDFFLSEESYQMNDIFDPDLEGTFYYMDGMEEFSFIVDGHDTCLYFYMTGDDTAEIRVLNNEWETIGENEIPVNLIEGTWYRTEEYQSLV